LIIARLCKSSAQAIELNVGATYLDTRSPAKYPIARNSQRLGSD